MTTVADLEAKHRDCSSDGCTSCAKKIFRNYNEGTCSWCGHYGCPRRTV